MSFDGHRFRGPRAAHLLVQLSPKGACPHCNGLGEEAVFDLEKIVPDPGLSLREGAVEPLGKYRNNLLFAMLEMLGRRYDFTLDDPVSSFSEEGLNAVLYGDSEPLTVDLSEFSSSGGRQFLSGRASPSTSAARRTRTRSAARSGATSSSSTASAPSAAVRACGRRPCSSASTERISPKCRPCRSPIFSEWVAGIGERMTEKEWRIAQEVVKEIRERLRFLMDVGLGYLSLSRSSRSLSGGEPAHPAGHADRFEARSMCSTFSTSLRSGCTSATTGG